MSRPSWPLIVNSVLFIGACLFAGGFMLSGFAHWDPCVWVASTMFVVVPFLLASWQYAATFRAHLSAAQRLLIGLLICDGLTLFAAGGAIVVPLGSGIVPTRDYLVGLVGPMALLACGFTITSVFAFRRMRELTKSSQPPVAHHRDNPTSLDVDAGIKAVPRFTLAELLSSVVAISVVLGGIASGIRDIVPKSAMHVSPQEARLTLPAGASDVRILRGSRGVITFDFAIDESGFWEWAETQSGSLESDADNVPIKPVVAPFSIAVCDETANGYTKQIEITRGWYYSWSKEDRVIRYVFDADAGRVYYEAF